MKVIYEAIRRTRDIMLELDTEFISIKRDRTIYTNVLDAIVKMKSVSAGRSSDEMICVVADDTNIYINLLYISHLINSQVYFRQRKSKDKDGITYHNVHALALEIGEETCKILFYFSARINMYFCSRYVARSTKYYPIITGFLLQIIYNGPLKKHI